MNHFLGITYYMIRILLILLTIFAITWVFSVVHSLNRFYSGIFYKDKNLIQRSVDFIRLKDHTKILVQDMLRESMAQVKKGREKKQVKEPDIFGMNDSAPIMDMVVNAAGNLFVSKLIDQYVTPRYFIQFVTEAKKIKLTKPGLFKMLAVFPQMEFIDIDYFYIPTEDKKLRLYFRRDGFSWFLVRFDIDPKELKQFYDNNINKDLKSSTR